MAKIEDIAKSNLSTANDIASAQQAQLDELGLTGLTVSTIPVTYAVIITDQHGNEVDPEDLGEYTT